MTQTYNLKLEAQAELVSSLSRDEEMLLTLRDELYVGSWERMIKDLRKRMNFRPYNYKMTLRIEEDLPIIERLQTLELKHRVNLGELIRSQAETIETE